MSPQDAQLNVYREAIGNTLIRPVETLPPLEERRVHTFETAADILSGLLNLYGAEVSPEALKEAYVAAESGKLVTEIEAGLDTSSEAATTPVDEARAHVNAALEGAF